MRMYQKHDCGEERKPSSLYRIGMFAAMNHITVKTLRFYEEQGLLAPAHVDGVTGYRYYTMGQMADLHRITALKHAGFTLDEIRRLGQGADERQFLLQKKAGLMAQIAELTRQMAVLDGYMTNQCSALEFPVLIKTVPAVTVASVQHRIRSYDALFDLMPEMGAEMERLGCECALPEYCFTQYLEPGYQEENILVEICEAVREKKEGSSLIHFQNLPEVKAACIYHRGSYDSFAETYAVILEYIEENGFEICGNIRECYIDGVWNKEREEDWLSEIQIPIA